MGDGASVSLRRLAAEPLSEISLATCVHDVFPTRDGAPDQTAAGSPHRLVIARPGGTWCEAGTTECTQRPPTIAVGVRVLQQGVTFSILATSGARTPRGRPARPPAVPHATRT